MKFVGMYSQMRRHTVEIAIEAPSAEAAKEIVQQQMMYGPSRTEIGKYPVLSEEFLVEAGQRQSVNVRAVGDTGYPAPTAAATRRNRQELAMLASKTMVVAYAKGEALGGDVDWEDMDMVHDLCLEATPPESAG